MTAINRSKEIPSLKAAVKRMNNIDAHTKFGTSLSYRGGSPMRGINRKDVDDVNNSIVREVRMLESERMQDAELKNARKILRNACRNDPKLDNLVRETVFSSLFAN